MLADCRGTPARLDARGPSAATNEQSITKTPRAGYLCNRKFGKSFAKKKPSC